MNRHEFFIMRLKELGVYDQDADYDGMLGKWVEEMSLVFSGQGHSGCSAILTLELFNSLMNEWKEKGITAI